MDSVLFSDSSEKRTEWLYLRFLCKDKIRDFLANKFRHWLWYCFLAGMSQERSSPIQAQKPSDFLTLHGACSQHIEANYKIMVIVSVFPCIICIFFNGVNSLSVWIDVAQPGTETGVVHFPASFRAQQEICIVEKERYNKILKHFILLINVKRSYRFTLIYFPVSYNVKYFCEAGSVIQSCLKKVTKFNNGVFILSL